RVVDDVAVLPASRLDGEPCLVARRCNQAFQRLVEEPLGPLFLALLAEGHDHEGGLVELALGLTEHPNVDGSRGATVAAWGSNATHATFDVEVLAVRREHVRELLVMLRWDLELVLKRVVKVLVLGQIAPVVEIVNLLELLNLEEGLNLLLFLDVR